MDYISLQVTEIFENPVNAQCIQEEICIDQCQEEANHSSPECETSPLEEVCDNSDCRGKQVMLMEGVINQRERDHFNMTICTSITGKFTRFFAL